MKNERLDENSIVALVSAHVFDPCIGDLVSAVLAKIHFGDVFSERRVDARKYVETCVNP